MLSREKKGSEKNCIRFFLWAKEELIPHKFGQAEDDG